MTKVKRLLFITDEHLPETIPAYFDPAKPKKDTAFFKFLKDFQPHIIVNGGDALDLSCISHWNRGKPKLVEGKRLKSDYALYNQLLDKYESVNKSLEKHIQLEGNHCLWARMLIEENPQAYEGMIEMPDNLNLKSRGIQWIENGKTAKVGKLYFHHGNFKVGYSPEYHAKAIGMTFGVNMLYGHYHTEQVWTKVSPIDEHPIQTQCVGTLAHLNPVWLRNRPNAWVNSFWVGYVMSNGNFYGHSVKILQDQFVFDGQTYK